MSQISFSDAEYAGTRKKTRREVFLDVSGSNAITSSRCSDLR